MSETMLEVKHLQTVKSYRVKIPAAEFPLLEVDESFNEIVDPRVYKEVEKLAGDETVWSVYNTSYYPSPSGKYWITEWEVVCG